jgi:hypothetical protein
MLARSIRRHAARLIRRFSKIELREARAEVLRLQDEFSRINSIIQQVNVELATNTSPACVSTLIRKIGMNFAASSRACEKWADAIDRLNELEK